MYYPLRSRASFEVMPDKKIVGATEGQHRDLVIKILINGKPLECNRSSRPPAYCLIVHVPLSSCPRREVEQLESPSGKSPTERGKGEGRLLEKRSERE